MPYCPTHGYQQGIHCSQCGAPLIESPPAAGDSVRVRSPEATAIVNFAPESKARSRPADVECQRCGHINVRHDTFNCKGSCGRKNLCRRHFDEEFEVCIDCARLLRGEAKAEAERQAKLHADLAVWRKRAEQMEAQVVELTRQGREAQEILDKARAELRQTQERVHHLEQELAVQHGRAEQAETKVVALTQRSQQAETSLAQSTMDLNQSYERAQSLEKDLTSWRGRAEKAEGELAIIEHARQEAEAKKRREIVVLKPGINILDRYIIRSLIGEGGMARVWLAWDGTTHHSRHVAIKEGKVGAQDGDFTDLKRRFEWEASVTAALIEQGVPHIVPVWQVEPLGSSYVLVMTYMPGGDLADLIKQHPAGLPLERAEAITLDILAALAGMAKRGVSWGYIHGDIKPSNVLFDGDGKAYLADFGLSTVYGDTISTPQGYRGFGTPQYMAPEQVMTTASSYPSQPTDLYAFGCVFWEMLTGKPYKHFKPGTSPSQLRAGLPAKVDQVVMRALAEDLWSRWFSAEDMAEALRTGLSKSRSR